MKNRKPFKQTLIDLVDKSGGKNKCWPWTGAMMDGYGLATQTTTYGSDDPDGVRRRKRWRAHRAYLVFVEQKNVPAWVNISQTCGNPSCCNPKHLAVTKSKQGLSDEFPQKKGFRLTMKQVSAIRRNLKAKKVTRSEMADRFGLSEASVRRISSGVAWSKVKPTGATEALQAHSQPSPWAKRLRASIRKRGMKATAKRIGVSVQGLRIAAYPLSHGQEYSSK